MNTVSNASIIYNEPPQGVPVLDKTLLKKSTSIDLDNVELDGGVLTRALYFSVDPFQRVFMVEPSAQFYPMFYQLGNPIWGYAVVDVIRSEKKGIEPGAKLYVKDCPFQEYIILSPEHSVRVIDAKPNVPLAAYIGILGMPGQTAFYGFELAGRPVEGETICVVSCRPRRIVSAILQIGLQSPDTRLRLVVQLAKAKGLKVIASAGTDDKVTFLKEIGADVVFNYKTTTVADVLAKEKVNLYWDNVGGPTLEAAIQHLQYGGRIVMCGVASHYNSTEPYGVKTMPNVLTMRLSIQGFHVPQGEIEYEGEVNNPTKFLDTLVPMVETGQIKWKEQVFSGIESVPEAMVALQSGINTGKIVIKVASG